MSRGYGYFEIRTQSTEVLVPWQKEIFKHVDVTTEHKHGDYIRYYGFSDKFDSEKKEKPQGYMPVVSGDSDNFTVSFEKVEE